MNTILFSKRNLFYNDYLWSEFPKTDPKVSGKPDVTQFNAMEGNEVVYLINKLMNLWSYRFSNTGNKMEKMIREKMPATVKTQEEVLTWLKENLAF
ncbi:hypothetical protein [Desertivirga xinjiangensis]|uniref:hypothetical protein n=1 Tax=Desertivirga xinjiangensis TaxID=539206 RepID=UPI00210C25E2|nr:hypothetical protein [Pedobacter xinjiangensis]